MDISNDNKRIAKNTLMLYIRMLLVMAVSLYTSRVMLNALGIADYGIYNIVGSVVVAFSFISGPLGTATQRFLSYELGRKNFSKLNTLFSLSLFIYILLAIVLFFVIEIAGQWFIHYKMQLPAERLSAAIWAFHFSVLSFIISLFKICFDALIISHEKMAFYAYLGIAEVILKLVNALSIVYCTSDKLILFALNLTLISAIILFFMIIYCKKKMLHIRIRFVWDKAIFKELFGFSGWSLFGSIASMSANQGLNILLNTFYGVVVNAAMGIANQVGVAVNQFVINFQTAFRPQIVKSYASGQLESLKILIMNTSKYSFLLLFGLVCPIVFNIHFILEVWLKNVPLYAAEFCILMLIYALLETLSAPMWMTIQATGHIRLYQLVISSVIFLNILLSYVFLRMGFSPVIVLKIKCCLDVAYLLVRLFFIHKLIQFSIYQYMKAVGLRLTAIVLLSFMVTYTLSLLPVDRWERLIFTCIGFICVYVPTTFYIGLNINERNLLVRVLKKQLCRENKI